MDPQYHIGKRSAAGYYCWDCDVSLSRPALRSGDDPLPLKTCPNCGCPPVKEALSEGAVAVELGFAEPRKERPTGVRSASGFLWCQDPQGVRARCELRPEGVLVEDEYGDMFTGRQFLDMLDANCPEPLQGESIGQWFC